MSSLGPFAWQDKDPVYVLERHPYRENETRYSIWIKHDGMKITPVALSKLLADVLQSQVKCVSSEDTTSERTSDVSRTSKKKAL